ncbi:hypothetical protein [Vibrio vulnificus]|uniref:hypothetical protein n=1 Tax=Vibrio vulnificus TaxID=672 RepID=UPI001CDD4059|nr:hypothetical protein [Vibrio vulnificus]MCA3944529.1 hypothetical protein [Vibrio vulnificus]
MKEDISSKELIQLLHDLEDLETTSLEELVVEEAIKAGFIIKNDSAINVYRRAWIKKVTELANDAYRLEEVATGEHLTETIDNVKVLLKARKQKVTDTLELLAKQVLDATPPYSS